MNQITRLALVVFTLCAGMHLSVEQVGFLDLIKYSKRNLFLTGPAGTGKSEVVLRIPQVTSGNIVFTASTGAAAARLPNGRTLHSFSGVGISDSATFDEMLKNAKRFAKDRWLAVDILVIDEISMVSRHLFEGLAYVASMIRQSRYKQKEFFGGIRLIAVGDFLQLPPFTQQEGVVVEKCYKSEIWRMNMQTYRLSISFRQNDNLFISLLNQVREGRIDAQTQALLVFLSRPIPDLPAGMEPIKLVGKNKDAQEKNLEKLDTLPGDLVQFKSIDDPVSAAVFLDRRLLVVGVLGLKKEAQVMCLKNYPTYKLVNGSMGVVVGFVARSQHIGPVVGNSPLTLPNRVNVKFPLVTFAHPDITVLFMYDEFVVDSDEQTCKKRCQLPLSLAWFTTMHKSQGMTAEYLEVDLAGVWEEGQGYVALSRARSLERLCVKNFVPGQTFLSCDQDARNFFEVIELD